MLEKITELANKDKNISDFHLRGGSDIAYRILGDINIEPNSKIEEKDIEELLKKNCSEEDIKRFNSKNELDTAVMLGELRFREMESSYFIEKSKQDGFVFSTGGGIILNDINQVIII